MGIKRLKRCSTYTDVEADKGTEPFQIEVENQETDVKPKKKKQRKEKSDEIKQTDLEQQKHETPKKKKKSKKEKEQAEDSKYTKKDLKKLRKSFNEMTETMKSLKEFLLGRTDLPRDSLMEIIRSDPLDTSSSKKEEPPVTREELETYECNFETEDSEGNNLETVLVRGFDESLARDEIKRALTEHFSSCGKVKRVYVPIECKTGASFGYAFIDVEDIEKAQRLNLSYMGKFQLDVAMAICRREYYFRPSSFKGCDRCGVILSQRKMSRFLANRTVRRKCSRPFVKNYI